MMDKHDNLYDFLHDEPVCMHLWRGLEFVKFQLGIEVVNHDTHYVLTVDIGEHLWAQ